MLRIWRCTEVGGKDSLLPSEELQKEDPNKCGFCSGFVKKGIELMCSISD
jgi:hypothetical protein